METRKPIFLGALVAFLALTTIVFASLYGAEVSKANASKNLRSDEALDADDGADEALDAESEGADEALDADEGADEDEDEDEDEDVDFVPWENGLSSCFVSACTNEDAQCTEEQALFTDGCSDFRDRPSPYDVNLRPHLPANGCPTDDKEATIEMASSLSEAANYAVELAGAWFDVAIAADSSDDFANIYWDYEDLDQYGPYVWNEQDVKVDETKIIVEEILVSIFNYLCVSASSCTLTRVNETIQTLVKSDSGGKPTNRRKLLTNDPTNAYLSPQALDAYNAAMSSRDLAHKLIQWKNVIISDLDEVSDPEINICEIGLAYNQNFTGEFYGPEFKARFGESFEEIGTELRSIRESIREQLTAKAHNLCHFATLNFIEEKLDYNTLRESVSDGGVDTPRNAGELAALPNWHDDLWKGENDASVPNVGTDDRHPDTAIVDEDVIYSLNRLADSYLNSSSFSPVM